MKIERLIAILVIMFSTFINSALIKGEQLPSDKSTGINDIALKGVYKSPTPGEIPIIASTVFNSIIGPKADDLTDVEACGFNVCMDISTEERLDSLIMFMKGKNLKILIQDHSFVVYENSKDQSWKVKLPRFVDKYKNNDFVAGWKFYDEPRWNVLDMIIQRYDLLEKCDPGSFVYTNLVGEIAPVFTGPCKSMPQYLDSIQKTFKMNVWSFDYYPITIKSGRFVVNYKGFYTALDAFSSKSKETGIPMWSYLESMEFKTGSTYWPAATQPYLSFAAFSSLAYGAQGILYWTYWTRPSTANANHISALVDMEGRRMPAWYAAKKVNFQIKALTPVFLGAEPVEVRHTGMINMPGTLPYLSDFGPLAELTNDVKGVLVSHLRNNGHDYLVIVNHDVEKKQKVKMKFKPGLTLTEFKASDSGILSTKRIKSNYNLTLKPGGYTVLEWR